MSNTYKDVISIILDLKSGTKEEIKPIKQSDSLSRVLNCLLINNNKPINLRGSSLVLYIKKADKTVSMIDGVVSTTKAGQVTFALTEQSLVLADVIECEIVKFDINNVKLSFPIFKIQVIDSIYDEDLIESQDEFNALTDALGKVGQIQEIRDDLDEIKTQILKIDFNETTGNLTIKL